MNDPVTRGPAGAGSPPQPAAWISAPLLRPDPAVRLRLFCLPYAGGGASAFRDWRERLPAWVRVSPVQLPGREARWTEPAATSLPALVGALAADLAPLLDAPYALFGHSLGALVAFELARELRRAGRRAPARLVVSGCRPPQLPDPSPRLHHLPDAAFLAELRKFNGIPEAVLANPEYLGLVLPAVRADITLYETYVYREEPPLECPITAFAGEEDGRARGPAVAAWAKQSGGPFTLRVYPGDHFFLFNVLDQALAAVAADLSAGDDD